MNKKIPVEQFVIIVKIAMHSSRVIIFKRKIFNMLKYLINILLTIIVNKSIHPSEIH